MRIWGRWKAARGALVMAACGILVTCVGTGYAQGFVAGGGSPRAAAAPKPFASTITVATSGKTAGAFTSHYLGLSFESTALNAGNFDTGGNLPQLLKNLGSSTMRFGGLSVDNNIQGYPQWMGVSRRGLAGLTRLVKASGWTVFYSEDLADFPADRTEVTVDAARVAAELGFHLAAIGCGNEPDGYAGYGKRPAGYGPAAYDADAAACLAAIRQGAPRAPLGGADLIGAQAWFDSYLNQESGQLALAGEHLYPGAAKESYAGQSALSVATILLSSRLVRTKETETFRWVTAGAKAAGARPIMSETNSISSGGLTGVSDTFAAALWAINYSLLGAEYGMDGMNFHNMFFGTCAAYSEICPEASDPRQFTVRPIYYGLLFAHLLGTGKFLPVAVSTGATARNVVAYALKPASGGPHVMAENLTSLPTSITLAVGGSATSAKVLWLTAPGLLAKSGTRIQGATVSAATGVIKPGAPTVIRCSGGKCHLTLPAYTAAIVTLPLQAKCGGYRPAGDAKVLGRRSVAGEATSRETADQTQKKWPQKDSSYPVRAIALVPDRRGQILRCPEVSRPANSATEVTTPMMASALPLARLASAASRADCPCLGVPLGNELQDYSTNISQAVSAQVVVKQGNQGRIGLLNRIQALGELARVHPVIAAAAALLGLFVLVIDCMPVLVKIMSGTTSYDRLVETRLVSAEVIAAAAIRANERRAVGADEVALHATDLRIRAEKEQIDRVNRAERGRRNAQVDREIVELTEEIMRKHKP